MKADPAGVAACLAERARTSSAARRGSRRDDVEVSEPLSVLEIADQGGVERALAVGELHRQA
jgi:hypothetical protein